MKSHQNSCITLELLQRTGGKGDSTILCSEIIGKRAKQAYKIKTL